MCGICGAVWTRPELAVDAALLRRMTDVLRHRGPDDEGQFRDDGQAGIAAGPAASDARASDVLASDVLASGAVAGGRNPGVALGFRRLSIIDLAGGHQPISNEDGRIWLIFNGEIYNYLDLRRRLEGRGHQFRTHSDSESIVHLYEDEGTDCFQHLNGMFAAAIWDGPRRRLVLARDRLGKKPLVYRHEPGRLLFASELKSVLEVPGLPREIDPTAIDHYLAYQYVPHPRTILRGYQKLSPGHWAVWEDDRLEVRSYWQPDFAVEQPWVREAAIERLRELLTSSVRLRMQSDVPLGAFLSGGIDSSLIVALLQQAATNPVKTFSIGFPVAEYDERSYARAVARHLGTEHHEFEVTPDGVAILPRLVWHFDEPFADSSAIPTWYVAELTRRHVTVALSGDGGDELFAGYDRYRAVAWGTRLDRHRWLRAILGSPLWQRLPGARQKSLVRRFKRFSESLRQPPAQRYLAWITIFNETRRAALYSDDLLGQLEDDDPAQFVAAAWQRSGRRDALTAASLADLVTYLPGDLMTKVDIASMAHSLECRQPFLDVRLVEFAASLPMRWKYRGGVGKRLLREAFADLLPPDVWRRKKMGFGVPLERWFRTDLRDMTRDTLLDPNAATRPYFREAAVRELIEQHQSRQYDHAYRLWALLVFELWARHWTR